MLKELVLKNRTYRRFFEEERITEDVLRELVDLARTVPSTGNSQALKFALITEEEEREKGRASVSSWQLRARLADRTRRRREEPCQWLV